MKFITTCEYWKYYDDNPTMDCNRRISEWVDANVGPEVDSYWYWEDSGKLTIHDISEEKLILFKLKFGQWLKVK